MEVQCLEIIWCNLLMVEDQMGKLRLTVFSRRWLKPKHLKSDIKFSSSAVWLRQGPRVVRNRSEV